jgi:hypothetical protein
VLQHHTSNASHTELVHGGIFRIFKIWIIENCIKIESNDVDCTGHMLTAICHLLHSCYPCHLEMAKACRLTQAVKRMTRLSSSEHDISELLTAAGDLYAHWAELWSVVLVHREPSRTDDMPGTPTVANTVDIEMADAPLPPESVSGPFGSADIDVVCNGPSNSKATRNETEYLKRSEAAMSPQDPRKRQSEAPETAQDPIIRRRNEHESVVDLCEPDTHSTPGRLSAVPAVSLRSILKRAEPEAELEADPEGGSTGVCIDAAAEGRETAGGKRRRLSVAWREDIDDVREYDVGRDGGSLDKSVAHMRKEMHIKVSTVM